MKNIFVCLCFSLLSYTASIAQILEPVKWTTSVEKISSTEYVLIAYAKIDSGWHLYSQSVPDGGPIPTSFTFEESEEYVISGKAEEEKGFTIDDPIFKMKIKFFENKARFKQHIKISNKNFKEVIAEVEYMVCDDTKCLPPTYEDLVFKL